MSTSNRKKNKSYSPHRSLKRSFLIFWHLFYKTFVAASLAMGGAYLRYVLGENGGFHPDDDSGVYVMAAILMTLPIPYHVLIGTQAIQRAETKRTALIRAINMDDADEFARNVDQQISFTLECTLTMFALVIYGVWLLVSWPTTIGLVGAFVIGFQLMGARQYAWVRDNPLDGPDKLRFKSREQAEKFTALAYDQQRKVLCYYDDVTPPKNRKR